MKCLIGKVLATAGVVACILGLAQPSSAGVYNLAADWSSSSNPNGVWTYGYYSGSTLTPGNFVAFPHNADGPNPGCGSDLSSLNAWDNNAADPNIIKNNGATFTTVDCDQITFNSGAVTFGPFMGPTVARWTSPKTGLIDVFVSFETVQVGNTAPDAHVFLGNTDINLGVVSDMPTTIYDQLLMVNMGDTIDFVVWGNNQNNKTTEVSATLTWVPEPGMLAIFAIAIAGTGYARRRRIV